MTLEEILGRLQGVRSHDLRRAQALCPAHEDKRQSLSISLADDGRILVNCHAGCELRDVLAAVELTERDLFPSGSEPPADRDIVYEYRDETNQLLFEVVRRPGKRFFQRRPNGTRGWINNLAGTRRVPYRLPEVLAADPSQIVFIVEGEKDAENLRKMGELATTNPGGVGSSKLWQTPPFRDPFRGRNVVILPDNDEPGRQHAENVVRALHGHARSVKVIRLPGLQHKGDVSDWIADGGTREKLQSLVAATTTWTPPDHTQGKTSEDDDDDRERRERPTQARLLVALAQEHAELFKTADGEAYATIRRNETVAVRSKAFRSFLLGEFFNANDKTPSSQV